MKLRYYQEDAIEAALAADGNALAVLPTGSGKSLVIGGIIERIHTLAPHFNVLVLQHRKELVEQNFQKLAGLCPLLSSLAGVYSASVGVKQLGRKITFAQIQSIHNKADLLPTINYCIIDEVHRIKREDAGMYRTFINNLRARNPKIGLCGLTATAFRMSTGMLTEGKDPLFPEITYEIGMRELIEKGYLSPLVSKFGAQQADLKKVGIRQGEYVLSDMENAISPLTQAACDEIVALGQSRKHWLLFTPGVKSAHEFAKALVERGVRAEALSGEMGKTEREAILTRFARGETRALTNCDILTEGYDFQGLDLIAILRGTKSPGLFVQICGRGLRTREGKKDCLVLDYAGNLERFGAVDCIKVRKTKDGYKLATKPLKSCPQCGMAVPATVRDCECGHVFERLAANHEAEASTRSVLSEVRELNVHWTTYKVHNKPGKPPSLKVIYECENKETIREFICFEHEGYAKKKACQWWRINQRADSGLPVTVQDAFFRAEKELKPVRKIKVQPDGKFWKVIAKEYGEREAIVTGSDELYESDGINI